ncbi:uncharacterized protein N7484_008139 [Penicillium longicatenatum]|uniref:uncharacterized protein n=1 Tax=Penicillium longicatenatum TaxID=1561947 RepID=UPI002548C2B9|nr:uncharacterized protein N7484_008139 [Penicillium longicatenatum]KAJ5640277.1 hypothetical protein N7484_008139 [Penicillium longicatenatum]
MSIKDKHCTELDFQSYQELLASSPSPEAPLSKQQHQLNVPAQSNSTSNPKKRAASPSSKDTRKIVGGAPRSFGLPQVCEEGKSHRLIVREESPWDTYRRTLKCTLAGDVFIAARRSGPSTVVAIRKYINGDVAKMRRMYDILDHDNVLTARECFVNEGSIYALVNDLPLTLEQLVGCRALYPTETELASMVWQILCGLCYLNNIGLEHQDLTCRNILLGLDGVVKIASLEMCVECPPGQAQILYIKKLASMTMEIMQKFEKDDGMVGVDDVERWPVDSDSFEFLSALLTTKSIESLKEQPLVRRKSRLKGELVLLARSILVSARMFYSYER